VDANSVFNAGLVWFISISIMSMKATVVDSTLSCLCFSKNSHTFWF